MEPSRGKVLLRRAGFAATVAGGFSLLATAVGGIASVDSQLGVAAEKERRSAELTSHRDGAGARGYRQCGFSRESYMRY